MEETDIKEDLIKAIEKLVESDPNAIPTPLEMLSFLELEDLIAIEQSLHKSKANRGKENDLWFDELCKKD